MVAADRGVMAGSHLTAASGIRLLRLVLKLDRPSWVNLCRARTLTSCIANRENGLSLLSPIDLIRKSGIHLN